MENANGLFSLKCVCGQVFKPEINNNCPNCNLSRTQHKEVILDINQFLDRVYSLEVADKRADAIDVIFDVFFNLWDNYDIMNSVLDTIDPSKLSGGSMCSVLTNTFKYSEQVPNHKVFFQKVCAEYIKRGKTEQEIKRTLSGLEGAGNHWETMEQLGATGWIWGPNPNK